MIRRGVRLVSSDETGPSGCVVVATEPGSPIGPAAADRVAAELSPSFRVARLSGWRDNGVVWMRRSDPIAAVCGVGPFRRPHARRLDLAVLIHSPGRSSRE